MKGLVLFAKTRQQNNKRQQAAERGGKTDAERTHACHEQVPRRVSQCHGACAQIGTAHIVVEGDKRHEHRAKSLSGNSRHISEDIVAEHPMDRPLCAKQRRKAVSEPDADNGKHGGQDTEKEKHTDKQRVDLILFAGADVISAKDLNAEHDHVIEAHRRCHGGEISHRRQGIRSQKTADDDIVYETAQARRHHDEHVDDHHFDKRATDQLFI